LQPASVRGLPVAQRIAVFAGDRFQKIFVVGLRLGRQFELLRDVPRDPLGG